MKMPYFHEIVVITAFFNNIHNWTESHFPLLVSHFERKNNKNSKVKALIHLDFQFTWPQSCDIINY